MDSKINTLLFLRVIEKLINSQVKTMNLHTHLYLQSLFNLTKMRGGFCFKGINPHRQSKWERIYINKTWQAREQMRKWLVSQGGPQKLRPTLAVGKS